MQRWSLLNQPTNQSCRPNRPPHRSFGMQHLSPSCPTPQTSSTSPEQRGASAFDTTKVTIVTQQIVNMPIYAGSASKKEEPPAHTLHTNVDDEQEALLKLAQPLPVHISTPVNIPYFASVLQNHPQPELVQYLVHGLTFGFDIGTRVIPTLSRPRNHKSARVNAEGVTKAIAKELERGHMAGPFPSPPWPDLHCSPLGAREKEDGTFRLIMDLSFPHGDSINECISKDDFSVEYSGFDAATDLVRTMGPNCLMFKIDIMHAFRVLPIKPSQWKLMGSEWMGYYFIDFRLPFGLRSSPGIFNRFADAVCWILQNIYNLPLTIHYSDDYFFLALHPDAAHHDFERALQAFRDLGLPVAIEKTVPPTTSLPFLGILIDSSDMSMSVPETKKADTLQLLQSWKSRRKCTKTELLSLTGKLSHICKVVRPGRIFLRRLFDLTKNVKAGHHHIYLNENSRGDIEWRLDFLPTWSRSTIIPEAHTVSNTDICLFTDASKLGLGGCYENRWIQARWPSGMRALNSGKAIDIDYLEMFAIFAACATWGHLWAGKKIVIYTDNQPITEVWQAGTSKSSHLMTLVRKTFLETAFHQFSLFLKFIPGKKNAAADSISRFQVDRFKQEVPNADPEPTALPLHVKELLQL